MSVSRPALPGLAASTDPVGAIAALCVFYKDGVVRPTTSVVFHPYVFTKEPSLFSATPLPFLFALRPFCPSHFPLWEAAQCSAPAFTRRDVLAPEHFRPGREPHLGRCERRQHIPPALHGRQPLLEVLRLLNFTTSVSPTYVYPLSPVLATEPLWQKRTA